MFGTSCAKTHKSYFVGSAAVSSAGYKSAGEAKMELVVIDRLPPGQPAGVHPRELPMPVP